MSLTTFIAQLGAAGAGSDIYWASVTSLSSVRLYGTCIDADSAGNVFVGGYRDAISGSPFGWVNVHNPDGTLNASKQVQSSNSEILDGLVLFNKSGAGFNTVGCGRINSTYSLDRGYIDWNTSGGKNAATRNQRTETEAAVSIGYSGAGAGNFFYTAGRSIISSSGYVTIGKVTNNGSSFTENAYYRPTFFSSYPSDEQYNYGGAAMDSQGRGIFATYYSNCYRSNAAFTTNDIGKSVNLTNSVYAGPQVTVDSQDNPIMSCFGRRVSGYDEALLIKFNEADMSVAWARALQRGSSGAAGKAYSCTVDSQDNVLVAGSIRNGLNDIGFVAKFNSSGTLQWSRTFRNSGSSYPRSRINKVRTDSNDNVLLAGWFHNDSTNTYKAWAFKIPPDGIPTQTLSLDSETIYIENTTITTTSWTPSTSNYGPGYTSTGTVNSTAWTNTISNSGYTNTPTELTT